MEDIFCKAAAAAAGTQLPHRKIGDEDTREG
jgi:hypothetical protein